MHLSCFMSIGWLCRGSIVLEVVVQEGRQNFGSPRSNDSWQGVISPEAGLVRLSTAPSQEGRGKTGETVTLCWKVKVFFLESCLYSCLHDKRGCFRNVSVTEKRKSTLTNKCYSDALYLLCSHMQVAWAASIKCFFLGKKKEIYLTVSKCCLPEKGIKKVYRQAIWTIKSLKWHPGKKKFFGI